MKPNNEYGKIKKKFSASIPLGSDGDGYTYG